MSCRVSDDEHAEMLKHVFKSVQKKKGSFIKVFHQSTKRLFVATATDIQVNTCFGFSLSHV